MQVQSRNFPASKPNTVQFVRSMSGKSFKNFENVQYKMISLQQFIGGVVEECVAGTIFVVGENCVSGNKQTCERDEVVTNPTLPTNLPTTTTVAPPTIEQICDGVNLGIFPNPNSCTSYVLCIFGTGDIVSCPSSTPVFDSAARACAAGNKSKKFYWKSFETDNNFSFDSSRKAIQTHAKSLGQCKLHLISLCH
jgi:Chitin binding Peritrophin-A domain